MPVTEVVRTAEIPAPVGEVWAVLADFAAIRRWAPDVEHSCALSVDGAGVGAVRRVQAGRTTLVERVVEWDEPSLLSYSIDGLPPVIRRVTNTWSLAPAGGATSVHLTGRIEVGPRPPHRIAARVVARRLGQAADGMLAGLATELTTTDGARS